MEAVRSAAAQVLGLEEAGDVSKSVPKMIIVAPACNYCTLEGSTVLAGEVDLVARAMSMQRAHRAYPITGAICTAAAVSIEGTLLWEVAGGATASEVRIGHPAGVMPVSVAVEREGTLRIAHVTVLRTARRLMAGHAFVPRRVWDP